MEKAADGGGAASPAMQVAAAGTGMQGPISPSTDGAPLSQITSGPPAPPPHSSPLVARLARETEVVSSFFSWNLELS